MPEKPARKKTKPHKCSVCKAEFFHARQLQSHISFAHDNGGGSDGASGSPQISPESRPVGGGGGRGGAKVRREGRDAWRGKNHLGQALERIVWGGGGVDVGVKSK